jgi:hypothetical protein
MHTLLSDVDRGYPRSRKMGCHVEGEGAVSTARIEDRSDVLVLQGSSQVQAVCENAQMGCAEQEDEGFPKRSPSLNILVVNVCKT